MDNKSFDTKRIAEGYLKRPWLHKNVIEKVRADLDLPEGFRFKNGLDVGCGAGLSTKALQLICEKVTGTDISEAMIDVCSEVYRDDTTYSFYAAKAEETAMPQEKYDIVTAAGCINWVDEKCFMENMKEVTSDNAIIIIYDFGITDHMESNPEYTEWYDEKYLKRFPKPPRKENKWKQEDLTEGFLLEKQTEYEMAYPFGLEAFVDFMMIQSNVNSAISSGVISETEAKEWMKETLTPIFEGGEKNLIFSGYSWYIRHIGNQ